MSARAENAARFASGEGRHGDCGDLRAARRQVRKAMRKEWTNSLPAFCAEGAAGAARFASGKGRHGDFGDI